MTVLIAVFSEWPGAYVHFRIGYFVPRFELDMRWHVQHLSFLPVVFVDAAHVRADLFQVLVEDSFRLHAFTFELGHASHGGYLYVDQPLPHGVVAELEIPQLAAQLDPEKREGSTRCYEALFLASFDIRL